MLWGKKKEDFWPWLFHFTGPNGEQHAYWSQCELPHPWHRLVHIRQGRSGFWWWLYQSARDGHEVCQLPHGWTGPDWWEREIEDSWKIKMRRRCFRGDKQVLDVDLVVFWCLLLIVWFSYRCLTSYFLVKLKSVFVCSSIQIQCGVLTCWCRELLSPSRRSCYCSPGQEHSPWTSLKCKSQLWVSCCKCGHTHEIIPFMFSWVGLTAICLFTPVANFKLQLHQTCISTMWRAQKYPFKCWRSLCAGLHDLHQGWPMHFKWTLLVI